MHDTSLLLSCSCDDPVTPVRHELQALCLATSLCGGDRRKGADRACEAAYDMQELRRLIWWRPPPPMPSECCPPLCDCLYMKCHCLSKVKQLVDMSRTCTLHALYMSLLRQACTYGLPVLRCCATQLHTFLGAAAVWEGP